MADAIEFFIDRSLGRHQVPQALRDAGLTVHTMAEVYGEMAGQRLKDEVWLKDIGHRGWIVLMKDDAIRRRPPSAKRSSRARFAHSASPTHSYAKPSKPSGPSATGTASPLRPTIPDRYIYGVHADRIARIWPR